MARTSETTASSSKPPLKPRQAAFVREYIAAGCKNAKQAAIRAGYAGGASAEVTASRLLRNSTIAAEIEKSQARLLHHNEISPDRVLRELAQIAFSNPLDCLNDRWELLPLSRIPEAVRQTLVLRSRAAC